MAQLDVGGGGLHIDRQATAPCMPQHSRRQGTHSPAPGNDIRDVDELRLDGTIHEEPGVAHVRRRELADQRGEREQYAAQLELRDSLSLNRRRTCRLRCKATHECRWELQLCSGRLGKLQ